MGDEPVRLRGFLYLGRKRAEKKLALNPGTRVSLAMVLPQVLPKGRSRNCLQVRGHGGCGRILLFGPTVWAGSGGVRGGTHTHTQEHTRTHRNTNTHRGKYTRMLHLPLAIYPFKSARSVCTNVFEGSVVS